MHAGCFFAFVGVSRQLLNAFHCRTNATTWDSVSDDLEMVKKTTITEPYVVLC